MSDLVVGKLKEAFAIDASVEEACFYAGIHKDTYYDWIKKYPQLSDELEGLRQKPVLLARQTVVQGLANSPAFSFSYLRAKRPKEFAERQIVQLDNTEDDEEDNKVIDNFEEAMRANMHKRILGKHNEKA